MWQSGLRRGVLPWAMVADAIITQISTPRGGAYRSGVRGVRCDALQQKKGCVAGYQRPMSGDDDVDASLVQHLDLVRSHPRVGDDDVNVAQLCEPHRRFRTHLPRIGQNYDVMGARDHCRLSCDFIGVRSG